MSRLVTVAHGTRQVAGNAVARELTSLAGARLGIEAVCSYVELADPLFEDVVAGSVEPTVVVPTLLSTGFHLRQDLPRMARSAGGPLVLGRQLGPHRLIAEAQVARLVEAGARPGTGRVVMIAAGSSDPLATDDLDDAAALLAAALRGAGWEVAAVVVATLSALGRRPADVVRPGDTVSLYLLSPGFFADRARTESRAAGATVVSGVLGVHPLLVDLLVERAGSYLGG